MFIYRVGRASILYRYTCCLKITMAGLVKIISILPSAKVAEDEDVAKCSICNKGFASDVALRNHARMEHYSAYCTGDPGMWTAPVVKIEPLDELEVYEAQKREEQEKIAQKTKELISSMQPINLTSLASSDISYIIMEGNPEHKLTIAQSKKKRKKEKPEKHEVIEGTKHEKYIIKKVENNDEVLEEVNFPEDDDVQQIEFNEKVNRAKVGRPSTKEKVAVSLKGPFECLEPADGTADGLCHQVFVSCCKYSAHFRDDHTRRRKCLYCQVCEKPLLQGLEQSDIERIFNCMVCGIGFLSNKELKDHTNREHLKLKPFQCTVCPKRFTQQGGLQQHMRMHSGVRPFPCIYCPKKFTQKSGLEQHLRIHTKEKPYRCVVCHKAFIQPTHLKQHMRTHTNLAPFQCGICKKRFKQGSQLTCHLRVHGVTNMNDEQKQKYVQLLAATGDASEMIEIEVGQTEADLIEQVEAERSITICNDNEVDLEEAEAVIIEPVEVEEAIQIEQVNDDCYIIDENDLQTWTAEAEDS